jgi:hypothetical protein
MHITSRRSLADLDVRVRIADCSATIILHHEDLSRP